MPKKHLSPISDIIADAKRGKMFILIDDEDRENEGDLVIPAQKATSDVVNFMAKYGRGLICLPMMRERIEALKLPLMAQKNTSRFDTPFTVSIEAKEGVTTGISAADRAHTIHVAINQNMGADDLATPGHIFPLMARDGGVLVRAGHTEAAVDIARMAGYYPAGVICEILKDDGSMARLPDLVEFAKAHDLKIATIADLISYRLRTEKLVTLTHESQFQSAYGGQWQLKIYEDQLSKAEHVVLIKGNLDTKKAIHVRMHALSVLDDVLGDASQNKSEVLHKAMVQIDKIGQGVVVVLRDTLPQNISKTLQSRCHSGQRSALEPESHGGKDSCLSRNDKILRDYGIGAQILKDLGIHQMILLSNSSPSVIGLDGYDLEIIGHEKIEG
jgi:3,4-dihydroxy 2-butanone 4-phosphate synthase/GTP cyclohydrolase II